jgi:hypothetical protein
MRYVNHQSAATIISRTGVDIAPDWPGHRCFAILRDEFRPGGRHEASCAPPAPPWGDDLDDLGETGDEPGGSPNV